jgi:hypothetical protein
MSGKGTGAQNVEILRRIHDSFLDAQPAAVRAALTEARTFDEAAARLPEQSGIFERIDPEVVVDARHGMNPFGHGGLWRGKDEWWEFWRDWLETWEDFDYETSNFEAVGDHVLMDLLIRGRGRGSGVPVEWAQTQIWTFREGKVVQLRPGYESRAAALEALEAEAA